MANERDESRQREQPAEAPLAGPDGTGREPGSRTVTRLTDPRALRAMAHPVRLSLLGALRREGALTATQAGELIGESSASCSFHLRQLAKYGLVEEAGGGRGRERPWRATTLFTAWPEVAEDPAAAAASSLLSSVIAERYFEYLMRWLDAKPGEPEEWQRAAHFGDTMLYVTADELADLAEQTMAMLDRYLERLVHPELRPPGSRAVTYLHLAFPGDLSGAREAGARQAGAREAGAREAAGREAGGREAGAPAAGGREAGSGTAETSGRARPAADR